MNQGKAVLRWGMIVLLVCGMSIISLAAVDHSNFIQSYQGPTTCQQCHQGIIAEVQQSIHYKFEAPVPEGYLFDEDGNPRDIEVSGKFWKLCGFPTTVPQFNWLGNLADDPETPHIDKTGGCGKCHIGIGIKPYTAAQLTEPQDSEAENIDCLVCHAENYSRKFYVATVNGEPETTSSGSTVILSVPKVDGVIQWDTLTEAAKTVGSKPTANMCNRCHAAAGGGRVDLDDMEYSFKRGTPFAPDRDVHAAADMSCVDCHSAGGHKTERASNNDLYTYDNFNRGVSCTKCHGEEPHTTNAMYNVHSEFIACQACHATSDGGAVYKDFSVTVAPDPDDPLGLYAVKLEFADENFKIDYEWFNGNVMGEIEPVGSRGDGKIFPFKSATFNQPVDANGHPVPIKWGPFFKTGNMDAALSQGQSLYADMWTEEMGQRTGLPPTPGVFDHYKESTCVFSLSHAITKEEALNCKCCHTTNGFLDYEHLGYSAQEAEDLMNIAVPGDCNRQLPSSQVKTWDIFR
jgi:hypothetical protein